MNIETDDLKKISTYAKKQDVSRSTVENWLNRGKDKDGNPIQRVVIDQVTFVKTNPA